MTNTLLPLPADSDKVAADETLLFRIGAHMSRLTLGRQCTALGRCILRAGRIAAGYRRYVLGDRPGLACKRDAAGRIESGTVARKIQPQSAGVIGGLLSQVAPPPRWGVVTLVDGLCPWILAAAGVGDFMLRRQVCLAGSQANRLGEAA